MNADAIAILAGTVILAGVGVYLLHAYLTRPVDDEPDEHSQV